MKLDLTHEDVIKLEAFARQKWIDTPNQVRLPGTYKELDAKALNVVAWMEACLCILSEKGLLPLISVNLETADLEPDTEGV